MIETAYVTVLGFLALKHCPPTPPPVWFNPLFVPVCGESGGLSKDWAFRLPAGLQAKEIPQHPSSQALTYERRQKRKNQKKRSELLVPLEGSGLKL